MEYQPLKQNNQELFEQEFTRKSFSEDFETFRSKNLSYK